jgi:hypothetical protein
MFRRCLTTLLIVGYFAGQLAAAPHLHAQTPAGHGGQPHCHTGWLCCLFAANRHSADHHSHAHGHGAGHDHSHEQDHSQTPQPGEPDGGDHDSDCVYLPDVVAPSLATPGQQILPAGELAQLDGSLCKSPELEQFLSRQAQAPQILPGDGCPLFLKLRTLRI